MSLLVMTLHQQLCVTTCDDTALLVAGPRPCDSLHCQQLCVTTYDDDKPKGKCLCGAGYKIDLKNNIDCISKSI